MYIYIYKYICFNRFIIRLKNFLFVGVNGAITSFCKQNKGQLRFIYIYIIYEKPSKKDKLLLMEEILHQLIGSLSHYLQCFDTSQVVSRI